jgi:hypothetical protein
VTRDERDEQFDKGIAQVTSGAAERAVDEIRSRFWRHDWPRRIVPAMAGMALVFSLFGTWALSGLYNETAATAAAVTALRDTANQAKEAGDKANIELAKRGQATVPIPQPGQATDIEVIVSAATARVLASLPDMRPTAAELGEAVARYFAANPINTPGPSLLQISAALAGYFATNPPPSGPAGPTGEQGRPGERGEKGEQGPPPTAEQIQDAFVSYLRDHPDALCPRGGAFGQLRVQTLDGDGNPTAADIYTCIVATYPPPSTTTPTNSHILPTPTN